MENINDREYWKKVSERQKTLIDPQFNEDIKQKIFAAIKKIGISDSKEYLINKVFNPLNKEFYDYFPDGHIYRGWERKYNVEQVLGWINYDPIFSDDSLYYKLLPEVNNIIMHEARRLNPVGWDTDVDWTSKEIYFDTFFVDACGDFCAENDDMINSIDMNELKAFMLSIVDEQD